MSMRRSIARNIDGVHDSAWIRRETHDAQAEGKRLQEEGQRYLNDMDRIVSVLDAINDSNIDQDEADRSRTELDQMLAEAQEAAEADVVSKMEENEARLLELQEMAEDAASEHEAIAEGVDTAVEVTGFGISDVVRDIDAEGDALSDAASEAAAELDLQIQQAEMLQREARLRAIRGRRS